MTASRNLTTRLLPGDAESPNRAEIHVILATYSPSEGARTISRAVTTLPQNTTAPDQPIPYDEFLLLLRAVEADTLYSKENR